MKNKVNSVSLISCSDYIYDAIDFLSDNGFYNIELSPLNIIEDWDSPNLNRMKKIIRVCNSKNIKICSIQSIFFNSRIINIFNQKIEAKKHISFVSKISEDVGCNYIVFGGPKQRLMLENSNKECEKHISDIINSSNIKIGVEANPEIYGTDFLTDYNEVSTFCKKNNLNPHFDFGCAVGSKVSLLDSLKLIKSFEISHCHMSCPFLKFPTKQYFDLFRNSPYINDRFNTCSFECIFDSKEDFFEKINFILGWQNG